MDTQTQGKLEYILSGTGTTQDERNQIIDLMEDYAKEQAKQEMHMNMQYYMEHCQRKGYCTPQEWIEKHKHF